MYGSLWGFTPSFTLKKLPDLQPAGDPSLLMDAFHQKSQCLSRGRTQSYSHLAFLCWFTTIHKSFLGYALQSWVKAVHLLLAFKCADCRRQPIMD